MRIRFLGATAITVAVALLAAGCSSDSSGSRGASTSAGDPTTLAALVGSSDANGALSPIYAGAIVTPDRGVATSISPTIEVPGRTGAWKFVVTDLSDGRSGFSRTYDQSGPSVRIPQGAGLQQGRAYSWRATSAADPNRPVGGTFVVDTQMFGAQQVDSFAGFDVALASGEGFYSWQSHSVNAVGGPVGFGLTFAASSVAQTGLPAGWVLGATSNSSYVRLDLHPDGSVGLVSANGSVANYVESGGGWRPVRISGTYQITGAAPVLARNPDGTWSATSKQSTSTFGPTGQDGSANLIEVSSAGRPIVQQSYADGRLATITDPVSKRSVAFDYSGGKKSCPAPAEGFIAAPTGMLCQVRFWDGSTSAISYVALAGGGSTIGRIADLPEAKGDGAAVSDLAYDAVGRIVGLRSPIVAGAAASDVIAADDPQFLTSVSYDDEGRVAVVTQGAPEAGGPRAVHRYQHASLRSTTIEDPAMGRPIGSFTFDPGTFLTLTATDVAGRVATNEWDYATGNLLKAVDYDGNVTINTYEGGHLVRTVGPTEGSFATDGSVATYAYDQTFEQSNDGTPMKGLDATYWKGREWSGSVDRGELGPTIDGALVPSLTVNWPTPPVDSTEWSARLTGSVVLGAKGNYSFTSGGSARLWIDNVACSGAASAAPAVDALVTTPDASSANAGRVAGCDGLSLDAGQHSIRVDVASGDGSTSMSVLYAGPDTGGASVSIPTSALVPGYGYATTTRQSDVSSAATPADSISRTVFDRPATGQASAHVNQAGLRSTTAYAPATGASGEWGQQSATSLPAGNGYRFSSWGDGQSAKSSCPGADSAVQAGLPRSTVSPSSDGSGDGPSSNAWYDAAGRVVAQQITGGATTCTTYDRGGRVTSVEVLGLGRKVVSTTTYAVGGNPLVVEMADTVGTSTGTSRTEIDLLGRTVSSTDRFGVTTSVTYDARTGNVATSTIRIAGVAPFVTTSTYDDVARLSSISVDGIVTRPTYAADGNLESVIYGNGVRSTIGVDASNRPSSQTWATTDGHSYATTKQYAASGRVTGATWTADGTTSTANYTFDDAKRLARATLSAGLTGAHEWSYSYDANSNRTSQTADGRTWTSTYDAADRLIRSDDPAVGGSVEYDELGNATKVGADTFTYDAASNLIGASDGTTTYAFERNALGAVVSRTVTDASGSATIEYGSNGVVLDGEGRPLSVRLQLPGAATLTHSFTADPGSITFGDLSGNSFLHTTLAGATSGVPSLFDPFGQPLGDVPPAPASAGSTVELGWQSWTGNESLELRTPIVMMGARAYMPAIGRFLQLDPKVGGSANGYDHANQDPIDNVDPTGQTWVDWLVGGITLIGAIAASAATGGTSLGYWAILVGAAEGAAIAAAGYALNYGISNAVGYAKEWNNDQLLLEVGIGAAVGAIGGWFGAGARSTRLRNARIDEEMRLHQEAVEAADVATKAENRQVIMEMRTQQVNMPKPHEFTYDANGNLSFADSVYLENQTHQQFLQDLYVRKGQRGFYVPRVAID